MFSAIRAEPEPSLSSPKFIKRDEADDGGDDDIDEESHFPAILMNVIPPKTPDH